MTRGGLLAASAAVTLLGSACDNTPTIGVTELNLDRPVDVSFACYGKMRQTNGRPGMGMASDPIIKTAMPSTICQALSPPLSTDMITPASGQETLTAPPNGPAPDNPAPDWYGFILQSASGTVALAKWPTVPADAMFPTGQLPNQFSDTVSSLFQVLDADPLTPGKNALSIGEDPVAIGTDKSGCFEITANAGSCDLSELDITSTLANIVDGSPTRPRVDRVSVFAGQTQILSKPSAMIVEPFRDDLDTGSLGNMCPATPASKLYIAYPSCHLVAEVQFGTGPKGEPAANVIGAIQFDANGTASVLTDPAALANLSCPTECPPDPGIQPVPVTPGLRPVALDYRLDPRTDTLGVKPNITSRLAIGADISETPIAAPLTVVDLDLMTFAPLSGTLLPIPLEADGGPVGVSALALSPQIGMGGDASVTTKVDDLTNDQAQYVYAVATDGTVRVADVFKLKRECDTQIDGRFLRNTAPTPLECLPLGRPDLPRRPGARSPGIELPGGAVANSVAIIKGLTTPPLVSGTDANNKPTMSPMTPQPALLLGYFAIITSSSGAVYVANVDDDYVPDNVNPAKDHAVKTSPVLVMAHQLRDGLLDRENAPTDCTSTDGNLGAAAGGPRLAATPVQQTNPNTLVPDLDGQLPRLQQVPCDKFTSTPAVPGPAPPVTALEFGAPEVQTDSTFGPAAARDTAYPDLGSVSVSASVTSSQSLENWTLIYEGTLESDSTVDFPNGPTLRVGQTFVDRNGMSFQDASRPFCKMGVEPGDIVEFQGCDPSRGDADCPAGYTCFVHPSSTVGTGACFLKSEAPRLQDACRDFLSSVRRYTVGTDANGGTAPGKLVLWERKHELSTTPVDGCVSDDQCDDLARAALVINQSADPFVEAAADTPVTQRTTHWSCMADPLRKAINTDPARNKRCVQVCDPAPPDPSKPHPICASGMICVAEPTSVAGGVCMEGIEPPQACLNGPQRYNVRAGEAFAVIGDQTGFVHPIIVSADGSRCVRDPNLDKDPLSIGRIPLTPPPCNPTPTDPRVADPFTGLLGNSTQFEANPCSLTVSQYESRSEYPSPCPDGRAPSCSNGQSPPCSDGQSPLCSNGQPPASYGTCRTSGTDSPAVQMNVPAIKFRNRAMTLMLVDPYRPSGGSCLMRDPANVPTNIPLVVPGYQIQFGVKGGYQPLKLALIGQQVSPVKVVRGPTESIWVIDDGDFLATSFVDVSTRGRVFRVESVPAPPGTNTSAQTIVNTMQ